MSQKFDNALHVMEVQGGSFVKSLAACYYAADLPNKRILRSAFRDYFNEYEARFRESVRAAKPAEPTLPTQGDAK